MYRCAKLLAAAVLLALLLLQLGGAEARADHARDRAVTRALQRAAHKPVVRAALRRGALLRIAYSRQSNGQPITLALTDSSICLLGALVERPRGRTSVALSPGKKRAHEVLSLSQVTGTWSDPLHVTDLERRVVDHAQRYMRERGELVIGDKTGVGFYAFIARHPKLVPRFIKAMRERGVVATQLRTIATALAGVGTGAGGLAMMGISLHDAFAPALGHEPVVSSGVHGRALFAVGAMTTALGPAILFDKAKDRRTDHLTAVSRAMRDTLLEARARGISLGKLGSWL